jgi:hypothetical protein
VSGATDNLRDGAISPVYVGEMVVMVTVTVTVTAENGAIRPGDRLVAFPTPGYAMKVGRSAPQGTVIGQSLNSRWTLLPGADTA